MLSKPLVKTKKQLLLMDAILLAGALLAPVVARWMLDALPDCRFQQLGFVCPTCGGTHCVFAFFRGQFGEAFAFHPVIFCMLLYVLAAVLLLHLNLLRESVTVNKITRALVHPRAAIVWAIVMAVFGGVRMALSVAGRL